jgi:DNA primase
VSWDVARLLESLGMVPDPKLSDEDELVCHCPSGDHPDRTPSWTIRIKEGDKHGLFHCRSCGFDGDVYTLAMRVLGVSFPVAKAYVEAHAKSDEPQPDAASVSLSPLPLARTFRLPLEVVLAPLDQWPTPARRYAQERRGIESWQVDRWELGYASGGRLDGRIVVPVRNAQKEACSYTARAYAGQPVRYLTPREEEGADTSVLFGEEHAWDVDGAGVVVVEGALNALAVERVCEGPVLALGGSRVEPSTIGKLSRFRFVIVATDADSAGDKAASQLLGALSSYVPMVRVRLPEGLDPANAPREMLGSLLSEAVADVW